MQQLSVTDSLTNRDIALIFAKDIIMNNFKGRDNWTYEKLTKRNQRDNSLAMFFTNSSPLINQGDIETINPLDLTICIFKCSSPMLKSRLALKLFMCKLAIPFIFPIYNNDRLYISILQFKSIILDHTIKSSISEMALNCPCHVISFVRIGDISFSKSEIANKILNEYDHNTFFHRNCTNGTSERLISKGLVEAAWYVPSQFSKHSGVRLFLNLRGDGQEFVDQLQIVTSLSSICIIMIKINDLADKKCIQILDKVHYNRTGVIMTIDGQNNDENVINEKIEYYKHSVTTCTERTRFSVWNVGEDQIGLADIIQDIETNISKLVNQNLMSSIYERIQVLKQSTDEDEMTIVKVKKKVKKLKNCFFVSTVNCKNWVSWVQFFELESKKIVQVLKRRGKEVVDKHTKQVYRFKKQYNFMKTFLSSFRELNIENESQVFVLLIQCLLDEKDRIVTTQYKAECMSDVQFLISAEIKIEEKNICHITEKSKIDMQKILFGLKHINRFMGNMFAALTDSVSENPRMQKYLKLLPKLAVKLLLIGQPFEIMNGEIGKVPIAWIKAVFCELSNNLGENKCLVLSILGIQGSGKTTLLNTMFGLHCAVAADSSQKGVYIQCIHVLNSSSPFDLIFVVEAEGLAEYELADLKPKYEKDLATLAFGICDIAIVNIKGENTMEIKNVLQKVVKFLLKNKLPNNSIHSKKKCIFTHQNVDVNNANDELRSKRQRCVNMLDDMTSKLATDEGQSDIKTFNQVIQSDVERDFWYFSGFWFGTPPMAPVNPGYSETAASLRDALFYRNLMDINANYTIMNILTRIEDNWKVF